MSLHDLSDFFIGYVPSKFRKRFFDIFFSDLAWAVDVKSGKQSPDFIFREVLSQVHSGWQKFRVVDHIITISIQLFYNNVQLLNRNLNVWFFKSVFDFFFR